MILRTPVEYPGTKTIQSLRFEGRPQWLTSKQSTEINKRVSDYKLAWEALSAWDQKRHSEPVLQEIRLDRLSLAARKFLKAQKRVNPSKATPFLIGISGGSASGKTTAKNYWQSNLAESASQLANWSAKRHGPAVDSIELDNYYRDFSKERKAMGDDRFYRETDFDDPKQVQLSLAGKHIAKLKKGRTVRTPEHSFSNGVTLPFQKVTVATPFVLVEGIFAFVPSKIRHLLNLKIFCSADEEIMTNRWWERAPERNTKRDEVGERMFARAKAGYLKHIEPTRKKADVVINSGASRTEVQETLNEVGRLLVRTFYPVRHSP